MAELNHIGIAINDLPHLKRLFELIGFKINHEEVVTDQQVKTYFLPVNGAQANLELLEPLVKGQGPIGQALEKRGPGIHHISFKVEKGELDPLCAKLRAEGFRLTYDAPKPGAHGMRVNFIHPASAGGILIEVMEPQ